MSLVQTATVTRVSPNQPKTPVRTLRMDDEMCDRVKAAAATEGIDFSEWMRRAAIERLERVEDRDT